MSEILADFQPGDVVEVMVQLFTDPAAQLSPMILRSVVERVVIGFNEVAIGVQVTVGQLTDVYVAELGPALLNLDAVLVETLAEEGNGSGDRVKVWGENAGILSGK